MSRLSFQVFYLWHHVLSTFILWWPNLEILFAPLHRSSPFIGGLLCQAIQMEHGPYIAERTPKSRLYIVRYLWTGAALQATADTTAAGIRNSISTIICYQSPSQEDFTAKLSFRKGK
jgi:hypothetical protein